ncbi:MAG TPA: DUF2007 domain-containing protein [Rhodothermales bacterium]|nr:DUF2007 domain-containing protein [Rhodothermales bacterium]HRR07618.1 DUF2007 domain-containing protein [Rhodothermales bacterium]
MAQGIEYDGWSIVFWSEVEYESEIVRDRLESEGVEAMIMDMSSSSLPIQMSDFSRFVVMVKPEDVDRADEVITIEPVSEEELEEAAMNAEPLEFMDDDIEEET